MMFPQRSSKARLGLFAALCLMLAPVITLAADKPSGAQKRAAEEFLDAVASGDPHAVAFAIHPAELEALRMRSASSSAG